MRFFYTRTRFSSRRHHGKVRSYRKNWMSEGRR